MCGIAGIYRKDGIEPRHELALESALSALRSRGPNAEGRYQNPQITLGHRRLAIIDPEQGAQPWIDPDSGVVLVYNGEIYNFKELRSALQERNHHFKSESDTEVLMQAYLEWGFACVQRLRGIFAFSILDPRHNQLWLVRDRLGVKPLYYQQQTGGLSFASNVAALHKASSESPRWHKAALSHYLMTVRTNLGRQTLFQDIYTLLPGEELRLQLSTGAYHVQRYWELPMVPEKEKDAPDFEDTAQEIRQQFLQTAKEQLISDVPLGAFLSGGIDSSILCAAIQEAEPSKLETLSIGYDQANYNEWEAMEIAAEHGKLEWRKVIAHETDFSSDWLRLIDNKGLPLSTPNEVPIWRLAQAFSQSLTVAMTGEGADEIFGGYAGPTYCALDYDRSLGLYGGIDKAALIRGYGTEKFPNRRAHFLKVNSWIKGPQLERDFTGLFADGSNPLAEVHQHYDAHFEKSKELTTFDAYLHLHAHINLEGLLNRLDSSTMLASVEGRVPFTDHRIAEKLFKLPDSFKMGLSQNLKIESLQNINSFEIIQNGQLETKRLLRAAFHDKVSPTILNRKKVSFPVPFIEWFQSFLFAPYHEAIRSSPTLRSLLSEEKILELIKPETPTDAIQAWPLMNIALTEQQWNVT